MIEYAKQLSHATVPYIYDRKNKTRETWRKGEKERG